MNNKRRQNINWRDFITTDPNILLGKPVIKGTRISVEFILGLLSKGWTENRIIKEYDSITKEALLAVFSYIQDYFRDEFIFPLPKKPLKREIVLRRLSSKRLSGRKN